MKSPLGYLLVCGLLVLASRTEATGESIFLDRTQESGLDFVHFNGMSGELYYVEHMVGGAGLIDYDRDGDLDLYLVQGHMLGENKTLEDMIFSPQHPLPLTDRLYRNDLEITSAGERVVRFVDVTVSAGIRAEGFGVGVATGDIDNDGWVDLYVNNHGVNQMWRNNGDGTFSDVTDSTGTGNRRFSATASFFDFDRDGWLDLYVGNYVDWSFVTHRQCFSPTGARDYCSPLAYDNEPDGLYRNRGDGTFEDVSVEARISEEFGAALGIVAADFNGDGWQDIYVANDQMGNQFWVNQKDGTFVDEALFAGCAVNAVGRPEASMGVVVGDFDGNDTEDLFMAHLTRETNTLYLNDGTGQFRDATKDSGLGMPSFAYTGFGTVLFDYDSDSWLDLFIGNGAVTRIEALAREGDPYPLHQRNQLFRNLGGGSFEEVDASGQAFLNQSEVSRGVAAGDIDNDGYTDLVVFNNAGPARLLINNVGDSGRWVGFDLRTCWPGRAATGAKIGVFRQAGVPLWRRVRNDGGFASAHDTRLLVGLGEDVGTERVRVEWPGGSVGEWRDLPQARYVVAAESWNQQSQ